MGTKLKFALVSAIFLLPFAYPHSALSRNWSLSYQEAAWMCGTGNLQACEVMYAYDEMARPGVAGGSPTDSTWEMSASRPKSDAGATPATPK